MKSNQYISKNFHRCVQYVGLRGHQSTVQPSVVPSTILPNAHIPVLWSSMLILQWLLILITRWAFSVVHRWGRTGDRVKEHMRLEEWNLCWGESQTHWGILVLSVRQLSRSVCCRSLPRCTRLCSQRFSKSDLCMWLNFSLLCITIASEFFIIIIIIICSLEPGALKL